MRILPKIQIAALLLLAAAHPARGQGFSVVVHPSNPIDNLALASLREIFTGTATHWPNQARIVLAERASASPANQFLITRFLKTSWPDYKRSLEALEFTGREPVILRVLNSDQAACKFVFNVPSAVAVIETASLPAVECRDIKALKIEGLSPGQAGYRLK